MICLIGEKRKIHELIKWRIRTVMDWIAERRYMERDIYLLLYPPNVSYTPSRNIHLLNVQAIMLNICHPPSLSVPFCPTSRTVYRGNTVPDTYTKRQLLSTCKPRCPNTRYAVK